MKIVFLSHSLKGEYFRVGSHHLARELSLRGHDVVHVSTPISWAHYIKGAGSPQRTQLVNSTTRDEDGVLHTTYRTVVPIGLVRREKTFEKFIKKIGFGDADIVLIDQPLMNFQRTFPSSKIVYRPTDIHPDGVMKKREDDIVVRADAVVATSSVVLDSLPLRLRIPTLILENGVELGRFSDEEVSSRSGAVYIGAIDHRFDWAAINATALSLAPERVTIAGPIACEIPELPNTVDVVGPIPYDDISRHLSRGRIGLLPFNSHVLNSSRSPMKYYEYLAAGLYVVGRRTEALDARLTEGVELYDSISEIPKIIKRISGLRSANIKGFAMAEEYDWGRRAESLLSFACTGAGGQ